MYGKHLVNGTCKHSADCWGASSWSKLQSERELPYRSRPSFGRHVGLVEHQCVLRPRQNFADVLILTLKLLSDMPGWSESSLGRECATRGKKRGKKERKRHDPRATHRPARSAKKRLCKPASGCRFRSGPIF